MFEHSKYAPRSKLNTATHRAKTVTINAALIALIMLSVSACTQSTEAISTADQPENKLGTLKEVEAPDAKTDESGAKIVYEKPSVTRKGTNIKVLVNRLPITNYDIKRRAAFMRLRRIGGNRTKKATEELIEERIKLTEAAKLNSIANEKMVNRAFADFAKRNRLSPKQMGSVLGRSGVPVSHFKDFLKVQISWQRVVSRKMRGKSRDVSQSDALFELRKSGSEKPQVREYKLQQVIFVVPSAKRKKLLRARLAEAKSFAQRFTECKNTINEVKKLRDVAVKDLGRVMEPELPPAWKDAVIKTPVGKTTKIQDTKRGAEFIAVCSVRDTSDDRAAQIASQSKEFDSLNSKGGKVSNELLAELRRKATIVYR